VISGEKLAVKIEDLPSSFASLRLNLRPIGSSSQSVSVDQFEQLANNSYAWTLSLAAITQPTALVANLQLLRSPLDTNTISLLENSAFVYFPKTSDSQIQLQTEKVQLDTSNRAQNELVLEIPKYSGNTELFHKAYPGLSDAVLSRTLSVSLFKKTGEKALNLTPGIKDNRLTVSAVLLSIAVQNGLQPGKYDLKLEYGPAREPISAHKELEISK
jgi:hypothetical protein